MTETIAATDGPTAAAAADRVADVLSAGGVAVIPTDTVYGLAACPDDPEAVARLFDLKGRSTDVPIAVLCATPVQALSLAGTVDAEAARLAGEHWPGPLTLVLPRHPDLDWSLGEPSQTIGVRCPDHPLVRAVAGRIGPIAVTSANRHGEPTPADAASAAASLTAAVDLVVDGGTLPGAASSVIRVLDGETTVLRAGPIEP